MAYKPVTIHCQLDKCITEKEECVVFNVCESVKVNEWLVSVGAVNINGYTSSDN